MNIGVAAAKSGVPPKTIRYYENIGLLRSAPRLSNGYRDYDEPDVHTLRFVRHARRLGFSVPEVASLLALWRERRRSTAEVKAIAARRVAQINRKLRECEELKRMLLHLAGRYHDGAHAGRQAMRSPGPKSPN